MRLGSRIGCASFHQRTFVLGSQQQRTDPHARRDIQKREGENFDRNINKLRSNKYRREASGRDRKDLVQEVHAVHDDACRELHSTQEEAYRWLRYQFFDNQLPHGADVQAQAGRFRYPLHGRD